MPRSNKPMTLRDLNNHDLSSDNATGGNNMPSTEDSAKIFANGTSRRDPGLHDIYHIPTLPQADQARHMLERVVKEFLPIAKRRGYAVLSVSELCCCNDGLDFRSSGKKQQQQRKLRKVSNNVWGYNRTMSRNGRKVHTIHLRLRHAQNHRRFLPYEDVAGTLAHELSHCEYGPHNEKFYKLMDSILEEHATLMASYSSFAAGGGHVSSTTSDFVPFGGQGRALGGGEGKAASVGKPRSLVGPGQTLGGDASFTQWMTPREAAVAAALARQRQQQLRLRGNRCCRPCVVSGEGEDEVQVIDVVPNGAPLRRKRAPSPASDDKSEQSHKRNQTNAVIDLTGDEEDAKPVAISRGSPVQWACRACTFIHSEDLNACKICLTPKT